MGQGQKACRGKVKEATEVVYTVLGPYSFKMPENSVKDLSGTTEKPGSKNDADIVSAGDVVAAASESLPDAKRLSKLSPYSPTDEVVKEKSEIDFTKGGVDNFKFYPDNPENHRHKYRWAMKEPSKFYDPCEESRQASINCVLRNQEDKLVCQEFFDAYKECRTDFFNKKKKDRKDGFGGWGIW